MTSNLSIRLVGRVWGSATANPSHAIKIGYAIAATTATAGGVLIGFGQKFGIFLVPIAFMVSGSVQVLVELVTGTHPERARDGLVMCMIGFGTILVGAVAILT